MTARRIAGKVGCGGPTAILFPPLASATPAALQVGIGDHRHQGVAMKTLPGAAFQVIKARAVGHGHLARPFAAIV